MQRIIWIAIILGACDDAEPPEAQQPSGQGETVFTIGDDPSNPFFKSLGTNERTCASCHDRDAGWSITPIGLQATFDASDGTDPVFRPGDGATTPDADVSTIEARRAAYDLLLTRGLIRVGQPIPANAEFELIAVTDPYGFATAAELSLFRRPLPSTNLRFLSQIMWDSRESSLDKQARDATLGHAQATEVDPGAVSAIVAFESSIYTAQRFDDVAGDLSTGAAGGAAALAAQTFQLGQNDVEAPGFDRDVFTLFDNWTTADTSTARGARRASIARGERIFNTEDFRIDGVAGLSDRRGTCSTCHDTPDVGSHSTAVPMDIGASDREGRPSKLPIYTLRNLATGQTVTTTDPGLALITGKWADLGRFKVPSLRGLAMRPPYFHNGRADNLDEVVDFYRRRFDFRLSDREQVDLVAFLSSL